MASELYESSPEEGRCREEKREGGGDNRGITVSHVKQKKKPFDSIKTFYVV